MDFPSFSESLSQTLAAWGLPTTLLDAVNPVVRSMLWGGLLRALEVSAMPRQGQGVPPVSQPAGVGSAATRCAPLPFTRQPLAQPRSQQQKQSGWLDLSNYLADWHQNVRLALWVPAEALEALRAAPDAEEYRLLFSEQCRCIGQWYGKLEQWARASLASIILQGELRFLRHRTSAVATALLFAAESQCAYSCPHERGTQVVEVVEVVELPQIAANIPTHGGGCLSCLSSRTFSGRLPESRSQKQHSE